MRGVVQLHAYVRYQLLRGVASKEAKYVWNMLQPFPGLLLIASMLTWEVGAEDSPFKPNAKDQVRMMS